MAGQVFRTWNTCVKLAWGIPRSSHNYFVDFLASPLPAVKKRLLCQYVTFLRNLSESKSREVRVLAKIVSSDIRSVTARNTQFLKSVFDLDPGKDSLVKFKQKHIGHSIPEEDKWRLVTQRSELNVCEEDTSHCQELLESLCTS